MEFIGALLKGRTLPHLDSARGLPALLAAPSALAAAAERVKQDARAVLSAAERLAVPPTNRRGVKADDQLPQARDFLLPSCLKASSCHQHVHRHTHPCLAMGPGIPAGFCGLGSAC